LVDEDDDDVLPSYDDVTLDDIEEAHSFADKLKLQKDDDGDDVEVMSSYTPFSHREPSEDEPLTPEALGTVLTKYRVEAEIPNTQRKDFESNRAFHGRHVALSNTKRIDNLRHLDAQDLCNIYDRIPTMRHRATLVRMRETGEFQMCRSNPEIGGFEAKIGVTNIRREDVDVRQAQSILSNPKTKKRGFFGLFRGKK